MAGVNVVDLRKIFAQAAILAIKVTFAELLILASKFQTNVELAHQCVCRKIKSFDIVVCTSRPNFVILAFEQYIYHTWNMLALKARRTELYPQRQI